MGRPTKLTPEIQAAICAHIEKGNFPEVAAQAEGIDPATYYRWMAKGKDPSGPKWYREFRQAVARARAAAKVGLTVKLNDRIGTVNGGRHAEWLLEKLDRRRYGERIRIEVEAQLNRALDVIERTVDPETYAKILDALDADDEGAGEAPQGEARSELTVH